MEYKLIGKKIKKARNDKKLTQEELAEKLDLSVSYISQVESGKKKFNLKRIIEASEILEKPIEYFVEGYDVKNNNVITEITELLSKMDGSKIKLVSEIVKIIYRLNEDI